MQAILAVIRWALLVALALLRWVGLVTAWCRDFVAFSTQETVTADTINCERALLPKVPTHIAFILNGADSSIVDVGRLLAWSFSLDIRYVTVFDRNGVFKKQQDKIIQEARDVLSTISPEKVPIIDPSEDIFSRVQDKERIRAQVEKYLTHAPRAPCDCGSDACGASSIKSTPADETAPSWMPEKALLERLTKFEGSPDPLDPGHCRVSFVSLEDAHASLTLLSRQLATISLENKQGDSKSQFCSGAIDQGLLHDLLNRHGDKLWPLPDFAINYEEGPFLFGFLPWHLRYSEIFLAGKMHWLSWSKLRDPLRSFAKCVQRFGK